MASDHSSIPLSPFPCPTSAVPYGVSCVRVDRSFPAHHGRLEEFGGGIDAGGLALGTAASVVPRTPDHPQGGQRHRRAVELGSGPNWLKPVRSVRTAPHPSGQSTPDENRRPPRARRTCRTAAASRSSRVHQSSPDSQTAWRRSRSSCPGARPALGYLEASRYRRRGGQWVACRRASLAPQGLRLPAASLRVSRGTGARTDCVPSGFGPAGATRLSDARAGDSAGTTLKSLLSVPFAGSSPVGTTPDGSPSGFGVVGATPVSDASAGGGTAMILMVLVSVPSLARATACAINRPAAQAHVAASRSCCGASLRSDWR